jgi:hypothetical protein
MVLEEFLSDSVEPIHADSFFSVSKTGEIHERLCYEYFDPERFYWKVVNDDDLLREEVQKIADNMQYYLDEERVEINGDQVKSQVKYADIFLKGKSDVVAILFLIDFAGQFNDDINRIETWLEEEEAPYDFEIIWRFPAGTELIEIDTLLDYEIYNDIVTLWAFSGQQVGGYERMEFKLTHLRD